MKSPLEVANNVTATVTERLDQAYKTWLDKLTTLSLTALTLLVALQNTYVPRSPRAGWLLAGCWLLLALAVLAGLLALFGEARSHRLMLLRVQARLREDLQARQATGRPLPTGADWIQAIQKIPYTRPRAYLAAAATSAGALALAVVCLASFAVLNL